MTVPAVPPAQPVYDAMAQVLAQAGTTHLFGLIGRGNIDFQHSMVERGVRYFGARHEGAAVCMADAYARASGRLGVCTVTVGPAVTNTATAMLEASLARTPVLLVAAEHPRSRRLGAFDAEALLGAAGAVVRRLQSAERAAEQLVEAARLAVEQSRCVAVLCPTDVQAASCTQVPAGAVDLPSAIWPQPEPGAVERAAVALAAARRPVILAGRGALGPGAGAALAKLAELVGARLVTTMPASGLFGDHPLAVGTVGVFGHVRPDRLAGTDVLLAVGCSLNRFTTRGGTLFPEVHTLLRVDADPAALAVPEASVAVLGDASSVARALAASVADRVGGGAALRNVPADGSGAAAVESDAADGRDGFVETRALFRALNALLPPERTVVTETSHGCGHALQELRVRRPRHAVSPFASQSIGLGLAAAVGAAAARPHEPTVAVVGDGGALMALGEFETVARSGLPILVVVVNDGAYGAEVRELEQRGLPTDAARYATVDFASLARALGMSAATVTAVGEVRAAAAWAGAPQGPYVLDCRVDPSRPADWFREAIAAPGGYLRVAGPQFPALCAGGERAAA